MPVDNDKATDLWYRYQYLRDNGHWDYVRKAVRCENFFQGLQWSDDDLALLKSQRRPALTINKILSTMSNVMGEQIYNRTDISFRPKNGQATDDVADALTKTFKQISDNNQLDWVRSDVFADGIVTSRGFFDVRLDFTDSLQGEVRLSQLNPKNVLVDADAESYDPEGWGDVITTKWMGADDIELLYSKADAELLRGRQDTYFPYGYDAIDRQRDRFGLQRAITYGLGPESDRGITRNIRVLERQWRKLDRQEHFVDLSTGDTRPIPGEWDRNKIAAHLEQNPGLTVSKKLIHRIRWTVVADNVVLHDDWSPYNHFTVVPFFPYFRRGRTMGLVENLLDAQELLNKSTSQELHIVNTSANSGWKVKTGSLKNMTTGQLETNGAQTGLVLELDEIDSAEKIQPNQVPQGIDRLAYKGEEAIKSISGVSDYMTGQAREDVSAKAVRSNQMAGQGNLAKVMDSLNRTDVILAKVILDQIQSYYTEPRLIRITTNRVTGEQSTMTVNEVSPEGEILRDLTVGEYGVTVTNEPEKDTYEDNQFDQIVMMRNELGIKIPDDAVIAASKLREKTKIADAMKAQAESPEAQKAAQRQDRLAEAETQLKEAEAAGKQADAGLKGAKTGREQVLTMKDAHTPIEDNGAEAKMQEIQLNFQLDIKKMQQEFQLEVAKLRQEMQIKQMEAQQDMAIKQQEAEQNARLKEEQAAAQRAAAIHNNSSEPTDNAAQ